MALRRIHQRRPPLSIVHGAAAAVNSRRAAAGYWTRLWGRSTLGPGLRHANRLCADSKARVAHLLTGVNGLFLGGPLRAG